MFCEQCGTKIEKNTQFCQNCGKKLGDSPVVSVEQENIGKNYSPIFWKYFWVGLLLNLFSRGLDSAGSGNGLWILFLVLAGIYIYKFCTEINEAMILIGKKNWWPLGLLALIPFGFWVAFLVVRGKLKPHGMWISEHKSFKMSKKI